MKKYTYRISILDSYEVEVIAKDGDEAESKIYEMSLDEIKEVAMSIKNLDAGYELYKAEPIEEDKEND